MRNIKIILCVKNIKIFFSQSSIVWKHELLLCIVILVPSTICTKKKLLNFYIQLGLIRPSCFPFFAFFFSFPLFWAFFHVFSFVSAIFNIFFNFLILSSCNKVFKVHTKTTLKSKCLGLGQGLVWETWTTKALDNLQTYDLFQSNKDGLRWRPALRRS